MGNKEMVSLRLSIRWGFAAVLAFGLLALGGIPIAVLVALAGALVVLVVLARASRGTTDDAAVLLFTGLGLCAWTALQLVPLPIRWLATLTPHAADIWQHALDPMVLASPDWVPLSLDPVATRVQLLRGVVYVMTLFVALAIARSRDGGVFLERVLVLIGLVLAAVTFVHVGLDAHALFGLYTPKTPVSVIAPLMNTNQLGGYLNIAMCIALGSMLSPNPLAPRPLLGAAVVSLIATVLWFPSRGAVAGVVGGVLLVVVLTLVQQRRPTLSAARFLLPMLVAGAGVSMMVWADSDRLENQLGDTDLSKFGVQWHALHTMGSAFPIFGVGRGAFESTFPEFRTGLAYGVWSHPENVIVQWISEWGIPVTVIAFAAIAWALRPRVVLSRERAPIGPWVAIVVLTLHNLVDFSSEIPGVVLSLVACVAIVVTNSRPTTTRWMPRPPATAAIAAGAAALAIVLVIPAMGHELLDERLRLKNLSTSHLSREAFFAEVHDAILRHPGEPYFPYIGAVWILSFAPKENIVPWIDRTLERSPLHPPAHLVLARWLRPRSRTQALLEYRLAAEQRAGIDATVEAEVLIATFEDALELAPAGKAGTETLEVLATHLRDRLPATSERIDIELLVRDPSAVGPRLRQARDAVVDLHAGDSSPWCAENRSECFRVGRDLTERAQRAAPDRCDPYWFATQIDLLEARKEALDGLASAAERVADRPYCLGILASAAIAAGQIGRANEAIDKLANAACSTTAECVNNFVNAAALEQSRGNRGRALALYKRASDASPERDDLVLLVAQTASTSGTHAVAADAWKTLAARHPENNEYATAEKRESEAARGLP